MGYIKIRIKGWRRSKILIIRVNIIVKYNMWLRVFWLLE